MRLSPACSSPRVQSLVSCMQCRRGGRQVDDWRKQGGTPFTGELMLLPRPFAAALALCLVLAATPAAADNSGTALKVIGAVVTIVGIVTENPALVKWGWGVAFAGDVCGSNAAAARLRRRRFAESANPTIAALRANRPDA